MIKQRLRGIALAMIAMALSACALVAKEEPTHATLKPVNNEPDGIGAYQLEHRFSSQDDTWTMSIWTIVSETSPSTARWHMLLSRAGTEQHYELVDFRDAYIFDWRWESDDQLRLYTPDYLYRLEIGESVATDEVPSVSINRYYRAKGHYSTAGTF